MGPALMLGLIPLVLYALPLSARGWRGLGLWLAGAVAVVAAIWLWRFGEPRTNEGFVASTEAALVSILGWTLGWGIAERALHLATGRRERFGRGLSITLLGAAAVLAPGVFILAENWV